jgi:hypothetical protein
MKQTILLVLALCVLTAGCVIYIPASYEEPPYPDEYDEPGYRPSRYADEIDTAYFYDHLADYGYWARRSPHGYVWIPHSTAYGWRPYTHGRWLWTDHGWTWVSEYAWGWACFHYGRWGWDGLVGWYWVPDTVWGPAWVTWRRGATHIGWAPLPPNVRFRYGVALTSLPFRPVDNSWVFIENRHFYNTLVMRYILPPERNLTFIHASQLRTDIRMRDDRIVNEGIDVDMVSDLTGRRISVHALRDATTAGPHETGPDEVTMYRPRVRQNRGAAPPDVVDPSEVGGRVLENRVKRSREASTQPVETELERLQELELERLKESQLREKQRQERQAAEAVKQARTRAERERIEKDNQERSQRINETQEKEKSRIKERHTSERKRVSKSTLTKKKKK